MATARLNDGEVKERWLTWSKFKTCYVLINGEYNTRPQSNRYRCSVLCWTEREWVLSVGCCDCMWGNFFPSSFCVCIAPNCPSLQYTEPRTMSPGLKMYIDLATEFGLVPDLINTHCSHNWLLVSRECSCTDSELGKRWRALTMHCAFLISLSSDLLG